MAIEFENHSLEVKEKLNSAVVKFLYEAAGELVSRTQRNTPVDTGQLKGSWQYKVKEHSGEAVIGSNLPNAIWNELGTGQQALHGGGRKTPWKYQDRKGDWHTTTGKKPQRTLQHSWDSIKGKLQNRLSVILKEELGK